MASRQLTSWDCWRPSNRRGSEKGYLADHYEVHAGQVRQGLAGEAPLSDKE